MEIKTYLAKVSKTTRFHLLSEIQDKSCFLILYENHKEK